MRVTLATFLLLALAAACTDTPVEPGDPPPFAKPAPQTMWTDQDAVSRFTNALKRELSDPEMLALNAQASNVTDGERLTAVLLTLDYLDRAVPPDGSASCDAAAGFAYGSDGVWVVLEADQNMAHFQATGITVATHRAKLHTSVYGETGTVWRDQPFEDAAKDDRTSDKCVYALAAQVSLRMPPSEKWYLFEESTHEIVVRPGPDLEVHTTEFVERN